MNARFVVVIFLLILPSMASAQPAEIFRIARSGDQASTGFQNAVFSPDGKYILTGQSKGIVKLWDSKTGAELLQLKGHKKTVRALAFSPNSRFAITGSKGLVVWWDLSTGKPTNKFKLRNEWITIVKYSPDGRRLIVAGDDTAQLLDSKTGDVITELTDFSYGIRDAEFSPTSNDLILGERYVENVWLLDMTTGQKKVISDEIESAQIDFSPDGRAVVIGGMSKQLAIYSTSTYRQMRDLKGHRHRIFSTDFSPDGRLILTGSATGHVRLWKSRNGKQVFEFFPHGEENGTQITNVQFSPDGKRFLTVSPQGDGIAVWEVPKFF